MATLFPIESGSVAVQDLPMPLLKGLLLPITGPVTAMMWVAEQLLQEARRQYYDEPQILNRMLELEQRFAAGEVDEEAFDDASDLLVERLLEARAWNQADSGEETGME